MTIFGLHVIVHKVLKLTFPSIQAVQAVQMSEHVLHQPNKLGAPPY